MKLPFLTLRKHIELNVYAPFGGLHDMGFLTTRAKSPHMKRPKYVEGKRYVSSCAGFIDVFRRGMVLHSWMDWDLLYTKEHGVRYLSPDVNLVDASLMNEEGNGFSQRANLNIIRVVSPFHVECKEPISFVSSAAPFFSHPLGVPGAVLDFKHQHATNFFLYAGLEDNRWRFRSGEQLMSYMPMSDRPLKVRNLYDPIYHRYLGERSTPLQMNNSFIKRKRMQAGV